jgi:hypothetical protein
MNERFIMEGRRSTTLHKSGRRRAEWRNQIPVFPHWENKFSKSVTECPVQMILLRDEIPGITVFFALFITSKH